MSIDWEKTLTEWKPSGEAVRVTDQEIRDDLIHFLEMVGNFDLTEVEIGHRKWKRTSFEITRCKFNNDNSLMIEAAKQLGEHKELWETHNLETNNVAYEFPIAVKISDVLYYFKIIIYVKGILKKSEFEKIKNIELSFHPNKHGIKKVEK